MTKKNVLFSKSFESRFLASQDSNFTKFHNFMKKTFSLNFASKMRGRKVKSLKMGFFWKKKHDSVHIKQFFNILSHFVKIRPQRGQKSSFSKFCQNPTPQRSKMQFFKILSKFVKIRPQRGQKCSFSKFCQILSKSDPREVKNEVFQNFVEFCQSDPRAVKN